MREIGETGQDDWLKRLHVDASGRDQAIEELRCYLVRGLTKSLSHRYGGKLQIEDVVQVALLKILSSLDSFQHRSRFTTWALSIATRIGISELRRHYYRDVSLDTSSSGSKIQLDVEDASANRAEQYEERKELVTKLEKLINETLTDKQRIAIQGTLAGLSVEVIAERLKSNRNAVYKLVHDARLRLRQGLESEGITIEDIEMNVA